ncbi:DUF1376 domain-containing protein [Deefgea sp. CFH1-16]|uniref:DUF1376 domain-containing protein n=1 Tax=Deefgea sp. CFH1-16 TaxID=2675457 RepID=UPI0015F77D85|nr:DUF1376 domain-containing protein [Deefgea sp. CFH1-16]MBM5575814.1 DUF1376 domain-containing protein [Deefgea sp. CFH1-16]
MFNRKKSMHLETGVFLTDVVGFTLVQRAAYHALLIAAWETKGVLPNDTVQLAATCCNMPLPEFEANRAVLMQHFEVRGTHIIHPRMLAHFASAERRAVANRLNGLKGGRPKKAQSSEQSAGAAESNLKPIQTQVAPIAGDKAAKLALARSALAAVQNKTKTNPIAVLPPVQDFSFNPADLPIPERRLAIARLIRGLEEKRGVNPEFVFTCPETLTWAVAGVTDDALMTAYAAATEAWPNTALPASVLSQYLGQYLVCDE